MLIQNMHSEEQKKDEPQKKLSCLGVIAATGTFLGVLLAVIDGLEHLVGQLLLLPEHFALVIRISSFQISIGLTVIIALIILLLMGLSFTLGMFYLMFSVFALFTKKKTPLFIRPFAALSYPFLHLANWISERKYNSRLEKQPPSELKKRILSSLKTQKGKKAEK